MQFSPENISKITKTFAHLKGKSTQGGKKANFLVEKSNFPYITLRCYVIELLKLPVEHSKVPLEPPKRSSAHSTSNLTALFHNFSRHFEPPLGENCDFQHPKISLKTLLTPVKFPTFGHTGKRTCNTKITCTLASPWKKLPCSPSRNSLTLYVERIPLSMENSWREECSGNWILKLEYTLHSSFPVSRYIELSRREKKILTVYAPRNCKSERAVGSFSSNKILHDQYGKF